jgi:hypothetical protein
MTGRNCLWCARQHGHSVQVMLSMYGACIERSIEADVEVIRRSMQAGATAETIHGAEAAAIPVTPGVTGRFLP